MAEEETPEPTDMEPALKLIWADLVTFGNDVWWGEAVEANELEAPDGDESKS